MNRNYFLIDGSALLAQIRFLRKEGVVSATAKLCPLALIHYFHMKLHDLHGGSFKRAVFYFPTGDEENVGRHMIVPDHKVPGVVRDLSFKYCGHKLKKSAKFDDLVESIPSEFKSRFNKSEKGIDIEICCDAFKFAALKSLDRIFLLTNDSDFVPLCKTLKDFGANVSLIHLSEYNSLNGDLIHEVDTFDVVEKTSLTTVFKDEESGADFATLQSDVSLKPVSDPSDLAKAASKPDKNPQPI